MHIYLIQTYEMVKMLAMNKKLIVYLIILLNLLSCDASYPLLVEGRSKYHLSEDCGVVDIYGTSALSDWVEMDIDGNFVVFPDSLRLSHSYSSDSDLKMYFYLNDNLIDKNHSFSVCGREQLKIRISAKMPLHWGNVGVIKLFPSNFILCGDKPVISDTISIVRKSRR